jgi:hypothetical protein
MKRLLLGLTVGFLGGALAMAYLAKRANVQFVQLLRLAYEEDEERLAACARRHGEMHEAARHYANAADASSLDGLALWKRGRESWKLGWPIVSLVLERTGSLEGAEKLRWMDESRNRAMLAQALDRVGRSADAAEEYTRAAHLLDADVSRARSFATHWTPTEDKLLDRLGDPCPGERGDVAPVDPASSAPDARSAAVAAQAR